MTRARDLLPHYRQARQDGATQAAAYATARRAITPLGRMASHAPAPWVVTSWATDDSSGYADVPVTIADSRGFIVAAVSNDAPAREANATAARIVECVNALAGAHDAAGYIEYLQQCRETLDRYTQPEK